MPSEKSIFQPDTKLAKAAHVSSFQQYEELYKESIEHPEQFWGKIAKQFHWETPYDPANFMTYNFDISKGPISIKWMEGASTNLCYNLLDRNIKNGHGDKVAFLWYLFPHLFDILFSFCVGRKIENLVWWVEKHAIDFPSCSFHPRARTFQRILM